MQPMLTGAILIRNGTVLPDSMRLESEPCSADWRSITSLDRRGLDNQLGKAGWTFFFMAGDIKTSACGFDRERAARTAVSRAVRDVQSQKCNCLEITRVTKRSWLGIPYVSVFAHARHIQPSGLFSSS
jgi:hypothetical protein